MTATHITAPDGSLWQLVPVEPDETMLTAAGNAVHNATYWAAAYAAMLADAPEFCGVAVAWPGEAKPAIDGDGWVAITRGVMHRMDESQAQVWNASRAACIAAANRHPPAAAEAMGRDAARYREFCRQAEERQFPTALLDDAEEMGAGVLDMHFDAAMRGTAEKAGEG